MLVSVVIPAHAAQSTIERAIRSVIAQTWADWEAIIVSDDGADYETFLSARGLRDKRLRFVSTGGVRTGCHNARNVGLAAARGDAIAALDADDVFGGARLATLAPLAMARGAAVDNPAVVLEQDGTMLYRAFGNAQASRTLGIADFLAGSVPLFPLVRRDHAQLRVQGIEYAEDVLANLRLIDRLGGLLAIPQTLFEYRVVTGSLCHDVNSVAAFERTYTELIGRFTAGNGFDLSAAAQAEALPGLIAKRAFNRAFGEACRKDPSLNFQIFAASRRKPEVIRTG
jgi:glycosyltransferase involved in cell wall biosynthesis